MIDRPALSDLPLEHLPDSVHELISIIDVPLTLMLIEARAGRELSIPTAPHLSPWLVELIGYDAVEKLSHHYSGEKIDVPRCVAAMRAVRDHAIYSEKCAGASTCSLAFKYDFTTRGIRKVLARVKKNDDTPDAEVNNPQASLF